MNDHHLKKGSALVFAMLLLAMLMVSGLAIVASSLADHRASVATSRSVMAVQNAESGIEDVLNKFKTDPGTGLPNSETLLDSIDWNHKCDGGSGAYDTRDASGNGYQVYLYEANTDPDVSCDSGDKISCDGTKKVSDVASVRSVGVYNGISRAMCAPRK